MVEEINWYAIWTRSRHEFVVDRYLRSLGFETFLPSIKRLSLRRDRKKYINVPLFPGYLFIYELLDVNAHRDIVRAPGVVEILGWADGRAVPIPREQVESIKKIVSLDIPMDVQPGFAIGKKVKVISGPFKGIIGEITEIRGKKKLVVSIDLLHRVVFAEFQRGDVLPVKNGDGASHFHIFS